MFKHLSYLLLASLLAGCAQFNVKDSYKLSTEKSSGLLVMSLFDTMSSPTMLNYRKQGSQSDKEEQTVMLGTIQELPDWQGPRGKLKQWQEHETDLQFRQAIFDPVYHYRRQSYIYWQRAA